MAHLCFVTENQFLFGGLSFCNPPLFAGGCLQLIAIPACFLPVFPARSDFFLPYQAPSGCGGYNYYPLCFTQYSDHYLYSLNPGLPFYRRRPEEKTGGRRLRSGGFYFGALLNQRR